MRKTIRYLLRFSYHSLLPAVLRKNLDLFHSIRGSGYPTLVEKPTGSSVLVLSPHPDDEVIGCGGVLAKHVAAGDKVKIVYMTDGGEGSHEKTDQEELISLRKIEAERARNILGIRDFTYLEYPDGRLSASNRAIFDIRYELEAIAPDVIYVPFFLETHPDHFATSNILARALQKSAKNSLIYSYEVWTPLVPTCIVDISDVIEIKRQALKQFATQRAHIDILPIFEGMARYRAFIHLSEPTYAECFFSCSSKEYLRLWSLLS